ncbi:MAG: beta-galactosidase [Phycisphaerae bacterium]|nr:beta-galactosidase [Phycisphaerae bacterium]
MKSMAWMIAALAMVIMVGGCQSGNTIDLSGSWNFRLDPKGTGTPQDMTAVKQTIHLPGSTAQAGYGDDIRVDTAWTGDIVDRSWFTEEQYEPYRKEGQVKVPFWLTPVKHYVGPAWYSRTIVVPATRENTRITLFLERCHWETTVWVDGRQVGMRNSLSTPHEYDLGKLSAGKHKLDVRVDNTVKIDVGVNAHSVSDHTQSNWNGIVGKIELRAGDPVWIDDVQVYPDVKNKTVKVRVSVVSQTDGKLDGLITITAESANGGKSPKPLTRGFASAGTTALEIDYPMGEEVRLWDEFSPNLYRLTVSITAGNLKDRKTITFGMREFGSEGTQFTINGRKTYLRGTLECAIFPRTGYPPTDVGEWERILKVAKAHGLNHIRFHSWCPPEAAFEAADKVGVYYHVECGAWATVGDGKPQDEFLRLEADRILKAYGNHPSFCMMAYGNEPGGKKQNEYLGGLVESWKAKDNRRLYTSAAGWPILPANQYNSTPEPRIQAWGGGLASRINAKAPETTTDYRKIIQRYSVPTVSHEIGQWCVYPNFDEIKKYDGVLKAYNFDIFRDTLTANHMIDQAHDFLLASGKLQTLCYKEDIESLLRTPGDGGFQLLDLHDFPGQGTALVGVLDPFWEEKGYVSPAEYHRFCCETVPLARMSKRVWTGGETFHADVEIAHFGPKPLETAKIKWTVRTEDKSTYSSGVFGPMDIAIGNGIVLGAIDVPLKKETVARKLNLEVAIEGTEYANDWDLWVYPAKQAIDAGKVRMVSRFDSQTIKALENGESVLLVPATGTVRGDKYGKVQIGFSSIFWNTAWTARQPPHTLGILCDPKHPALSQFPTEYHSNWQWWYLIQDSQAIIMNDLPPKLRPIVQAVDDWFTNRRLGLVFEARVGKGKLIVSGIDLSGDLSNRPVTRQMLKGILDYMNSRRFDPAVSLEAAQIKALFEPPAAMRVLGNKVLGADSEAPNYEAFKAIDGNPMTIWHTQFEPTQPDYPHELSIDLGRSVEIRGLSYLPRQDMRNGWIREYEVFVSDDPANWGGVVHRGSFARNNNRSTITFAKAATGRYVRFVALKGIDGQKFASIAELDVIPAAQPEMEE